MSGFFRKMANKWRYGLVWQVILDKLAHLGIVFYPYYWTDESMITAPENSTQGQFDAFECQYLGPAEFRQIDCETHDWLTYDTMVNRQQEGKFCYGLLRDGTVASFTWFDFDECTFRAGTFQLNEHEAYLYDMYTMKLHRGQGLAPYLRFKTVQLLKELGKTQIFSITDATNSSSRKFKQKLNVNFSRKRLCVKLFNYQLGHWTLKDRTLRNATS